MGHFFLGAAHAGAGPWWRPASRIWGVDRPGLETFAAILAFAPLVGWLGDALGPQATILFGVVAVALAVTVITTIVMRIDNLRLRFDRSRPGWLRLERGNLTEEVDPQSR